MSAPAQRFRLDVEAYADSATVSVELIDAGTTTESTLWTVFAFEYGFCAHSEGGLESPGYDSVAQAIGWIAEQYAYVETSTPNETEPTE